MSIGQPEKVTQEKVIDFFKNGEILDYTYLGNLEDIANTNIKEDLLRAYLKSAGYEQVLIDGAVTQLVKAAGDMTRGIYDAKLRIYWTPEVENKVLTSIQPRSINKDVGLLRRYIR